MSYLGDLEYLTILLLPQLPPHNRVAYYPFISSLNIQLMIKHKTLLGTALQKLCPSYTF